MGEGHVKGGERLGITCVCLHCGLPAPTRHVRLEVPAGSHTCQFHQVS